MAYNLCIAEKPSVAKDIASVIGAKTRRDGYIEGNGYLVTWAVGHLVGLAEPEAYGFSSQKEMYGGAEGKAKAYAELPLLPETFKLVVLERSKIQFRIVKDLMRRDDVGLIIDCGDMGAEGHILQWFIRQAAGCSKPVVRFCATSMTDEAIKAAMDNLQPIERFENVIKGEFCKKKADWILGMSLSRAMSLKYNAGINVGRVQSPTLYFVVKRFLEVTNFKAADYYIVKAKLAEGFSVASERMADKAAATSLAASVNAAESGVIAELETKKAGTDRPKLYDITELQRDANRIYGYTAATTLAAAQALYETQKVLTYPRTDSRYITSDLAPYMAERVKAVGTIGLGAVGVGSAIAAYSAVADKLLADGLNIDKNIVDDSKVTDHHAIIPTERINGFDISAMRPTIEESQKGLTAEIMANVLNLVLCRFLVAFAKPYYYEKTNVTVNIGGVDFKASGTKPLSLGFKAVERALKIEQAEDNLADEKNQDDAGAQVFQNIEKGQTVNVTGCDCKSGKTQPPKLHTEATLLTAMENAGAAIEGGAILKGKGIGTQATRAEIIKKLFDTEVVTGEKKGKTTYIKPTQKGLNIIRVLPEDLYSPKITADWETKIAAICGGAATEADFMRDFTAYIRNKTREVKEGTAATSSVSFSKEREVHGVCPFCGKDVYKYIRKNDKGAADGVSFYCAEKCGFNIDTADKTFVGRLGRKATEAEVKKLVSKKSLIVECKKKGGGTYRGNFTLERREAGGKVYCNLVCEPVWSK